MDLNNNYGIKKGTFSLEITTTALCDMACTYCFEGEKTDGRKLDNNIEIILSNIERLAKTEYFQTTFDCILITFWGGEPTLNYNFIIEIMNALYNKTVDNISFQFMIYSNGYHLGRAQKILDFAKEKNFIHLINYQISYDGKIINDEYRLTKSKESTTIDVLSNFYSIARKYHLGGFHLKATIPLRAVNTIVDNWKEFFQLDHILKQFPETHGKNILVSYSPTLDYVNLLPEQTKIALASEFEANINEIAKLEYQYFKDNGRHLMSWFGSKDNRVHCSAGHNMLALNIDGTLNYCHGSLYVKDKTDLQVQGEVSFLKQLTELDLSFIIDFIKYFRTQSEDYYNYNEHCKGCEATWCAVCPAAIYSLNKIKNKDAILDENLYSNNAEFLNCLFFKAFGRVDRALQKIIKEN
jgi:sulfatase maturation enzyme AslB (radical SAM superfamily)